MKIDITALAEQIRNDSYRAGVLERAIAWLEIHGGIGENAAPVKVSIAVSFRDVNNQTVGFHDATQLLAENLMANSAVAIAETLAAARHECDAITRKYQPLLEQLAKEPADEQP
ncbi:hypothetical protein [Rhizobium sp. PL01]|uniref:hypothetical protein n=1 Tax=Rhizobium sp. PL01 TaxID=3085631 RepID=UPI002980CAC6|nr:hypothetical protein [Rhizobium sp. PL01]MDW5313760.1 hypothetical protein [Rhizobium sp. PL01]